MKMNCSAKQPYNIQELTKEFMSARFWAKEHHAQFSGGAVNNFDILFLNENDVMLFMLQFNTFYDIKQVTND